jgi:hypothetical protein
LLLPRLKEVEPVPCIERASFFDKLWKPLTHPSTTCIGPKEDQYLAESSSKRPMPKRVGDRKRKVAAINLGAELPTTKHHISNDRSEWVRSRTDRNFRFACVEDDTTKGFRLHAPPECE